MKKTLALLLAFLLLTGVAVPAFAAEEAGEDGVNVTVDGAPVEWTDALPFIDENGRTLVPLRAIAEALGLQVEWDGETRTAIFSLGDGAAYFKASFPIGSCSAYFETKLLGLTSNFYVEMDTEAVIVNGRSFAPVRFLVDFFGYSVDWDDETRTVTITKAEGKTNPLFQYLPLPEQEEDESSDGEFSVTVAVPELKLPELNLPDGDDIKAYKDSLMEKYHLKDYIREGGGFDLAGFLADFRFPDFGSPDWEGLTELLRELGAPLLGGFSLFPRT